MITPRAWKIEVWSDRVGAWGFVGHCFTKEAAEKKAAEWSAFRPDQRYRVVPYKS